MTEAKQRKAGVNAKPGSQEKLLKTNKKSKAAKVTMKKSELEQFYSSAFGQKVIGITALALFLCGTLFAMNFDRIKTFYVSFYGPILIDLYGRYYVRGGPDKARELKETLDADYKKSNNLLGAMWDEEGKIDPQGFDDIFEMVKDKVNSFDGYNYDNISWYVKHGLSLVGLETKCVQPWKDFVDTLPKNFKGDHFVTSSADMMCNPEKMPKMCIGNLYDQLRKSASMLEYVIGDSAKYLEMLPVKGPSYKQVCKQFDFKKLDSTYEQMFGEFKKMTPEDIATKIKDYVNQQNHQREMMEEAQNLMNNPFVNPPEAKESAGVKAPKVEYKKPADFDDDGYDYLSEFKEVNGGEL